MDNMSREKQLEYCRFAVEIERTVFGEWGSGRIASVPLK